MSETWDMFMELSKAGNSLSWLYLINAFPLLYDIL
jgi:hypothetical protein